MRTSKGSSFFWQGVFVEQLDSLEKVEIMK